MNSDSRLTATRYIWLAFFFGLLVVNSNMVFYGASLDVGNVVMTIIVTIAALGATGFVWSFGAPNMGNTYISSETQGKGKRAPSDKLSMLRELLTEDELDAFKQRLMDETAGQHDDNYTDGELPLAALLDDEKQSRRVR